MQFFFGKQWKVQPPQNRTFGSPSQGFLGLDTSSPKPLLPSRSIRTTAQPIGNGQPKTLSGARAKEPATRAERAPFLLTPRSGMFFLYSRALLARLAINLGMTLCHQKDQHPTKHLVPTSRTRLGRMGYFASLFINISLLESTWKTTF